MKNLAFKSYVDNALKNIIIIGIKRHEFRDIDPEEISLILFVILDGLLVRQAYSQLSASTLLKDAIDRVMPVMVILFN